MALDVLLRVEGDAAFAAAALDGALRRAELEPRDRGLATDLVYGVLRWRGALDGRLGRASRRPLRSLDPVVRAALRIGAYQVLGPGRAPPHAAVSEAVGLVRSLRGKTLAGYANAVLRALAGRPQPPLDPEDALPTWLVERLAERLEPEELSRFAASVVEQPWLGLRVEPRRASREDLVDRLRREAPEAELRLGARSPLAVLARGLGPVTELPAYTEGWMTVQDEGAQVVTLLLGAEPGHRVLDACAGRGGKTTLLAGSLEGGAVLHAADRNPDKLDRLASDLARLGLPPIRTIAVDLEAGAAGLDPPYDRVLADLPCSGTGTVARRPEILWRLEPSDVTRIAAAQGRIAARCAGLLAPGGALLYSVCSVLPEEGREAVRALLGSVAGQGLELEEELELWPHRDGTDGFYAARLAKAR